VTVEKIEIYARHNVLGGRLQVCGKEPMTGYYRSGCCDTGKDDLGVHAICTLVSREFLEFSRATGNDLSTAQAGFVGLQPGDRWCLCAERWKEAYDAGVAPKVFLASTHEAALNIVSLEELKAHAVDFEEN